MKAQIIRKNLIVWWMFIFFLVVVMCLGAMTCIFAFRQKQIDITNNLQSQLLVITNEFNDMLDRTWEIYLPTSTSGTNQNLLNEYFSDLEGDFNQKNGLHYKNLLKEMSARDYRVKWIALFSPERNTNYIYLRDIDKLLQIPKEFPYYEELNTKNTLREVFPRRQFEVEGHLIDTIAVAGGSYTGNNQDSIVVGYDSVYINNLLKQQDSFSAIQFCILRQDTVVYSSFIDDMPALNSMRLPKNNGRFFYNGKSLYLQFCNQNVSTTKTFFIVNSWEYLWTVGRLSFFIFLIVLSIEILFVLVYYGIMKIISREVNIITKGLEILSNNELDYRIPEEFHQPEMRVIAQNINQMSMRLKNNLDCIVRFEKLQAEAEYSELQAKFNPHFLYNTLEIFRSRCFENGDEKTANMIAETAILFRGFLGDNKFISMREELSFCKRYLAIYHARYEDSVEVLFDIDSEVLQFGIIRNLFQPLIENYFEHGYDPLKTNNRIQIKGELSGENGILFTVTDNGRGMDAAKYHELKRSLNEPISSNTESYGLKNLNQRIKAFYGEEYGLSVLQNQEEGITFEVFVKQQKVKESEQDSEISCIEPSNVNYPETRK